MHSPRNTALLAALTLLLIGCGEAADHRSPSLLAGGRGTSSVAANLQAGGRLAYRFAHAYARTVYRRRPPRLPGTTAELSRRLAQAAAKVPPPRRHFHPGARSITLTPRGANTLLGKVEISDGRSPPFSVAFTVERRHSGWRVVSASPPG